MVHRQRRRWPVVVGVAVLGGVLLVSGMTAWRMVDGIRHAVSDPLPARADAVVVFAGEDDRFTLGRRLVEEGRAPVLVLSAGKLPAVASGWCGETRADVEVICVVPEEDATSGEARSFADLARAKGWDQLIGVTGDYHAQRAEMLLSRCYGGGLAMAVVDWPPPSRELTLDEARKTVGDWVLSRGC